MAAPPPIRGGNQTGRSFLQALANRPPPLNASLPSNPEIIPKTSYKGDIACIVTRKEAESLAVHYSNALIGKFYRGKPSMDKLNEAFKSVGFKGKYQLGSIDYRHVLIRFQDKEDYQRMWLKGQWSFMGSSMKVLKWTLDFSPEAESSIVPVWITIKHVPIFFYNETMIQSMGNQIGKFIKMDAATLGVTRPSAVKLCIEVDLRKNLPGFIRVGIEDEGTEYNVLKLPIEYEDLPSYCTHCQTIGHEGTTCLFLHPELKVSKPSKVGQNLNLGPKNPVIYRAVSKKVVSMDDGNTKNVINTNVVKKVIDSEKLGNDIHMGEDSGLTPNEKDRAFQLQQKGTMSLIIKEPSIQISNTVLPNEPLTSNGNEEDNTVNRDRNILLSVSQLPHRSKYCSKDDSWTESKKNGRRSSPERFSLSGEGFRGNRFTPLTNESGLNEDNTEVQVEDEEQNDFSSEVSADAEDDILPSPLPNEVEMEKVNTAMVSSPHSLNNSQNSQGSRKNSFFTQLNKIMSPSKNFSPNKIITRSSKGPKKDF